MEKRNRKKDSRTAPRVSPSRWTAFQVLQGLGKQAAFVEERLRIAWSQEALSPEDRRLSHQIVYGVLRNRARLDFWIDRMSAKGIESLPDAVVEILRIGLYQLAFLDRIPAHAAVNESIELYEAVSLGRMKGVVNAILRRFADRRRELDRELESHPRRLQIVTSHPAWIVEWAVAAFGPARAERWLDTNNQPPVIHLSPLESRFERPSAALERLAAEIDGAEIAPNGRSIMLPSGLPPSDLPAVSEGRAFVQDPGAACAVLLLDPKPGETIFDLCSAPGGKTLQIADRLRGEGRVVSVDSSGRRLKILRENLSRCGFESVEVVERDLTQPWPEAEGLAHAVLVDVPCSGLGTLRRKVDLRYRIEPRDVRELAMKSRAMLDTAASLVRPGGRLVFSTCTLTREENEEAVQDFLERHSKVWTLLTEEKSPGWLFEQEEATGGEDASDGAFRALFARAPIPAA